MKKSLKARVSLQAAHVNAAVRRAGLLVWRISGLAADQLVLQAANLTRPRGRKLPLSLSRDQDFKSRQSAPVACLRASTTHCVW